MIKKYDMTYVEVGVKIPLSVDRSLEITECDRSLFMLLKVKKKDIRFEVADDILQSGCVSETYKNYMFRAQEMDRLKKADKKGNNRAIKQLKEINKLVLKGHKLLKKILKQTQRALSRIRVPQTRGGIITRPKNCNFCTQSDATSISAI
jgi:hypothetical protein